MAKSFRDRLKEKRYILLDGAVGTELQRRGFKTFLPLWSARAVVDAPNLVEEVHRDYLKAGAEVITTNTFRTNVRTLRKVGKESEWEAWNLKAVAIARKARNEVNPNAFIAGSIAPVEDCYVPQSFPSEEEFYSEHKAHAELLARAGVDFLLLETHNSVAEARQALRAAKATGLPVLISFVLDADLKLLVDKTPLFDAVRELESFAPDAFLLNCFSAEHGERALQALTAATSLPVGLYLNGVGEADNETFGWAFTDGVDADRYLEFAKKWREHGAHLIGGCCGTSPEYIEKLHTAL